MNVNFNVGIMYKFMCNYEHEDVGHVSIYAKIAFMVYSFM